MRSKNAARSCSASVTGGVLDLPHPNPPSVLQALSRAHRIHGHVRGVSRGSVGVRPLTSGGTPRRIPLPAPWVGKTRAHDPPEPARPPRPARGRPALMALG